MRRPAALLILAAAILVGVVIVSSGGGASYRMAAIFDTADGMVAGQQVKIAGAVVGSVDSVQLAPGPKARIVMSVDRQFAPFRANATCSILPEGLISEDYVECTPGSGASTLPAGAGGVPTVPLMHTTVPVSVQDVLNTFSLPVGQRLGVLLSELGVATAGRGADLNGLFARSSPALAQSDRVLSIVNAQREQLATALGQTNTVLTGLANNDQAVRTFVDGAATVADTTAMHSQALGAAVHRLPPMLDALRPGLRSLDQTAANALPLLDELQASGSGLQTLTSTLPQFARAGMPALRALSSAAARGRPALRHALPVATHLLQISRPLEQVSLGADQLLVSMRQSGAMEGFLHLFYILATIGSLYDGTSHILTFTAAVAPNCILNEHTTVNVPGCDHNYDAPGQGRIPVNDPSCGPVNSDWENEFCGNALNGLPGSGVLSRRPSAGRGRVISLPSGASPAPGATAGASAPATPAVAPAAGAGTAAQASTTAGNPTGGLLHSLLSFLLK